MGLILVDQLLGWNQSKRATRLDSLFKTGPLSRKRRTRVGQSEIPTISKQLSQSRDNTSIRRERKTENGTSETLKYYTKHTDLDLKLPYSFHLVIDFSFTPIVSRSHSIIVFNHINSIKSIFLNRDLITSLCYDDIVTLIFFIP